MTNHNYVILLKKQTLGLEKVLLHLSGKFQRKKRRNEDIDLVVAMKADKSCFYIRLIDCHLCSGFLIY